MNRTRVFVALFALAAVAPGCQKRIATDQQQDAGQPVPSETADAGQPAAASTPDAGELAPPRTPAAGAQPAQGSATKDGELSAALAQFAVESSAQLRGVEVERRSDGPWKVRAVGGGHGDEASPPRMMKGYARAALAEGAGGMAPSARAAEFDSLGGAGLGAGPGGAPMRAGSTDDNAEFSAFLDFLQTWTDKAGVAGAHDPLDVRARRFLKVVDAKGRPQPAAALKVVDLEGDALLWAGTTYGDGRLPFYPAVAAARRGGAAASGKLLVEAAFAGARQRVSWDGASDLVVALPAGPGTGAIELDVVFAIDTTGSMGDEIDRIKATLSAVTEKLRGLGQQFDLRYGAVLFRDLGDEYVTSTHPFTADLKAFAAALQQVGAAGGGDGPESVNQAIAELTRLDWREGAAKVAFLIGDAPPHMDYPGDVRYGQSALAALARGIRIHAVAASGLDELGTLVFRQVAQFTRGKFIFIEYGSPAASAAAHGVTGSVESNNLDDILFEQLRDEVAHWGREPPASVASGK